MSLKMSAYLTKIQSKLPTWFKMRRDKNSIGAQFLNVMGLSLDDIQEILDYAYQNQFLPTADLDQVDIVYKTSLPAGTNQNMIIEFHSDMYDLQQAPSLEKFLTSLATDKLNHNGIFYDNPYYIDYVRNLVYVRKPYDKAGEYQEGRITMVVLDSNRRELLRETLKLNLHHVWNFFDEFGLVLDTPRLYGETNRDYKRRLLDVFRHPANAAERGLYNGIARELGLSKQITWQDGGVDLIISDARVKMDSIEVDGQPADPLYISTDESGRIVLNGRLAYEGVEQTVTYIAGLTMHQLHDKTDAAFQDKLFDMDGHATAVLQYYVDIINDKVPMNWGKFVWGVGYWDIATREMSGEGAIPTFYDAGFAGWKTYKV
ncbi:hypothetical protein D3C85_317820 [compost metagenome]